MTKWLRGKCLICTADFGIRPNTSYYDNEELCSQCRWYFRCEMRSLNIDNLDHHALVKMGHGPKCGFASGYQYHYAEPPLVFPFEELPDRKIVYEALRTTKRVKTRIKYELPFNKRLRGE